MVQRAHPDHLGQRYRDSFTLAHAVAHPVGLMLAMDSPGAAQ